MSAEGSSVKGSSQQSSTSFPKVKGGGPLFSGQVPLITGGMLNDTTPRLRVCVCGNSGGDGEGGRADLLSRNVLSSLTTPMTILYLPTRCIVSQYTPMSKFWYRHTLGISCVV